MEERGEGFMLSTSCGWCFLNVSAATPTYKHTRYGRRY